METSSYASSIAYIHGVVALYMIAYITVVYVLLPIAAVALICVFCNLTGRVLKK